MRLSIVLLVAALCGVVGGAWLIGRQAVGLAVIFDSVAVGAWALLRDVPEARPVLHEVPTLSQVLEKARLAP